LGRENRVSSHVKIAPYTRVGTGNIFHSFCYIGGLPEANTHPVPSGPVLIGDDNTFHEGVYISAPYESDFTRIGNGNYLMARVRIAHDSLIANRVTIAATVCTAGFVTILNNAWIGIGANIHQFTTVGSYVMIAMAERLTRDAPPFCTVVNNEAVQCNELALSRRGFSVAEIATVKEYLKHQWPAPPAPELWFRAEVDRFFLSRRSKAQQRTLARIAFAMVPSRPPAFADSTNVRESVCRILTAVLGAAAAPPLAADLSFSDYGLDSWSLRSWPCLSSSIFQYSSPPQRSSQVARWPH
jgi:UDP-N-acetylglucosamine acyltransferase